MPSPFPGMNPYLEQPDAWSDFHDRLLTTAAALLEPQLGDGYFVKVNQNIYASDPEDSEREVQLIGRGDVFVSEASPAGIASGATSAVTPPSARAAFAETLSEEEVFLEILDTKRRQVVTTIELLSPANKRPGPKRDQYLSKRRRIQASSSHFIELDLLRGHPRMPLRGLPVCSYYAMLARAERRPEVELWPLGLRDVLPVIPVPLLPGNADVSLDLQAPLHRVYDEAGYRKYIYQFAPEPPLGPEEALWARTIVPGAA